MTALTLAALAACALLFLILLAIVERLVAGPAAKPRIAPATPPSSSPSSVPSPQSSLSDVTVLFTNITDSVGLFERLGDAQAAKLINDYYAAITPPIRGNGGILNKLLGDRAMAFFGAPCNPDPDHPRRAVAAVLAIQSAVDALNARLAARGQPPLTVRIGVATGLATVGNVGPAVATDYTVLGEVVTLADRLEKLAKSTPARNLISDVTVSRLADQFTFRPADLPPPSQSSGPRIDRAFEVLPP